MLEYQRTFDRWIIPNVCNSYAFSFNLFKFILTFSKGNSCCTSVQRKPLTYHVRAWQYPLKYLMKFIFVISNCLFAKLQSLSVLSEPLVLACLDGSAWDEFKTTPYPLKYTLPQSGQVGQGIESAFDTSGYLALCKGLKSCRPTSVPMCKLFPLNRDCWWLRVSPWVACFYDSSPIGEKALVLTL